MNDYILLKSFDSAATAKEFCVLFELMGVNATVKDTHLFVAEQHLKKAKELAEDYFKDK
jgi:hypothetical protein